MDDFTFPTAAAVPRGHCKLPAFPPPWFVVADADADDDDDGAAPWGVGGGDDKMDMLWEDFNEELTRTPPVCPLSPMSKGVGLMAMMKEAAWLDGDGDGDNDGDGVNGKRGGGRLVVRRRRWSLLLMLRLLKKLFLVKKSRNQRTAPI